MTEWSHDTQRSGVLVARRRPNRITRPVAGRVEKSLPATLTQGTGGQIRTADQIVELVRRQSETGLANPLPRDTFPYTFGPGVPLVPAPLDPTRPTGRAEPRVWEYPVTWNLPGTTTGRLVPWATLRGAAQLPLIRDCLRIRKAEIQGLDWDFGLSRRAVDRAQRDQPDASRLDVEQQLRERLVGDIDRAADFWSVPDRGNGYTFGEWICQFLEEQLVLDAVAIYPRYTLGGDLYALEVLDGSTIKPLLDHRGGRPQPPLPAYQQILYGFPRGEFIADSSDTGDGGTIIPGGYTSDQLIYIRREVRTHTPYGLSPVEQALMDIDLWQKRVAWLRAEYTDGVMPAGWLVNEQPVGGASSWTPQQLAEYERELNDYYSGNTANRFRYRVLPPGLRPDDSSSNDLAEKYKPEFDLHLLKLVVAHFDLTVHELGFTEAKGLGSDGHAEGQDRLNERKGRGPVLRWIAELITDMSRAHLRLPPELEFKWLGIDDESEEDQEEQTAAQVAGGLLTINEGRDLLGRPRFTFPEADKAAIIAATGTITFIEGAEERAQAAQELAARAVDAKSDPAAGTSGAGSGGGGRPGRQPASSSPAGKPDPKAAQKAAEASAYRRWAGKGASTRRFTLEHLGAAELVAHGIDPERVEFLGKGDAPDYGAELDRIATRAARELNAAALDAVDVEQLAQAWAQARGLDKGLKAAVQAALAWLHEQGVRLAEALDEAVREAVSDGWAAGERAAVEQLGGEARSPSGQLLEESLRAADVTITAVADTRFDEMAEILATGVEQGLAPRQLAKDLRDVLDAPQWAETVAVTETARAMSAATQATYQANQIERKSWLLAPDQRVCPTCKANDAQGPIPTTDRFASGDMHPPAHPHCRCALMPVLDEVRDGKDGNV
jgi:SPP1 gp7 family putative phage head morphogenesis protein